MTDETQTEGNDAFARMVKLMLNTDFTYVMRLLANAQQALEDDQELDTIEPETKTALAMVSGKAWECRQALEAVIYFQRNYCAQQEEAD